MSIHSSLRGADSLKGERSVLTRVERLAKLQKDGKFDPETGAVWGLPKVRTKFKVVSGKKAKALDQAKADAAAAQDAKDAEAAADEA
ncbi:MAG TPA: small basic protein [Planctomycetes bacterium]|nr:small basic protein [Planctomycetota bacterium]